MLWNRKRVGLCLVGWAGAAAALADFTKNIMITGYWPPTNEMVRRFSTSSEQNPNGWIGENWENRGYNIYSFFPEFPGGIGKGEGDLEVDYQDTSYDFWRLADQVKPVAIITFSRASARNPPRWEVEAKQRNLQTWIDDYEAPFQPTPAPPDGSQPAGYVRESTLPMQDIVDAVADANLGITPFISENYGGGFLSEFIAYHGTWYQDLHSDPGDAAWCVAAGHIHVDYSMTLDQAIAATDVTLRVLTDYVDTIIPEPAVLGAALVALLLTPRRRQAARRAID